MQLILASQSPRRKELLGLFHIPFTVQAADVDETMDSQNAPAEEVARVSLKKANAIAANPDDVVIAADTVVVLGNRVLGKPTDPMDAVQMLSDLSGKEHQVMTGMTVRKGDRSLVHTEITHIRFRKLSRKEIQRYVDTGEPMDKAGGYGIQGGAALFVEWLKGDYYNVMGLPVCRLWSMLEQIAPEIMEDMQ